MLAAVAPVSPAVAQLPPSCRPVLDSAGVGRHIERRPGVVHQFGSGGVLIRCVNQRTTLEADSLAWYGDLDRLDFVGQVRFEDDTLRLTAQRARYFPGNERIEAFGNVVLVNRHTGSRLTGPNLTYWRPAAGIRDTAALYATSRPTVEYRAVRDTAAPPYVIVGDRVRLVDGSRAWTGGSVSITREEFVATGDSATLNLDNEFGSIIGTAEARSSDTTGYTIRGRRIDYRLADDKLRWVQAQGAATATSSDWVVSGDTIDFDIERDRIQGGRAWSDSVARAQSALHTITADSIAIDTPDQVLSEVRGFGRGHATSRADSSSREVDWMAGDTVVARFDSTADGGRGLSVLEARGSASAYYHIFETAARDTEPAISYARGRRITARFLDHALDRVDVIDAADGVFLEPRRSRP